MDHITWNKTDDEEWTSRVERTYQGTIVRDTDPGNAEPYELTIDNGGGVTTHKTLRNAKNEFRKFLFDKPVTT